MISCGVAAIATVALAPQSARAQAFQGDPTLPNPNIAVIGSATRTVTSSTSETITVGSSKAMINWTPSDVEGLGTIDFLPADHTATFTSANGVTGYTVLNRIVPSDPTRPVALNGNVIATLQGTEARGGNVWFYSPGGILVGADASFDVGGLLLTTLDPLGFAESSNGFGNFAVTYDTVGNVEIAAGATITAPNEGSYVALIAPRVVQSGNVQVNGQAAYVAAEDVTMTINNGLFDINVALGTRDTTGIDHSGTTGGPASTGATDRHRIYMVAVPKNEALTMLLGGNIGFADSASVVNGQVVLSAGFNIDKGNIDHDSGNGISASIDIDAGADFSSILFGAAATDITAIADELDIVFGDNADLRAYNDITFTASGDNDITVNGDLTLLASRAGTAGDILVQADAGSEFRVTGSTVISADGEATNGQSGTGGTIDIFANGGIITFEESAYISADAFNYDNSNEANGPVQGGTVTIRAAGDGLAESIDGIISFDELTATANGYGQIVSGATLGTASSGTGGTVSVNAQGGGAVSTGGDTEFSAYGTGGDGLTGATAGNGQGGTITVVAETDGAVTFDGLLANAYGTGGDSTGAGATGNGQGGNIFVTARDGTIDVLGTLTMSADGTGGSLLNASGSSAGGTGTGGMARVAAPGSGTVTITGATTVSSNGTGGSGRNGGAGYGGNAGIDADDGTVALAAVNISATGTGGNANIGFGGTGGLGDGGTAYIEALLDLETEVDLATGTVGTVTGGTAIIDASGYGGTGGASNGQIGAGAGGIGRGGLYVGQLGSGGAFASADAAGAILDLGFTTVIAEGRGGNGGVSGAGQFGGAGGAGYGGTAQAGTYNRSGTATPSGRAEYDGISINASATGGNGGSGVTAAGNGGAAYGAGALGAWGIAYLGGSGLVTVNGNATLDARAFGGTGAIGGVARGGVSVLQASGNGSFHATGNAVMDVRGIGGTGTAGSGGNGYGGNVAPEVFEAVGGVTVGVDADLDVDGLLSVIADGNGGGGTTAGGTGQGGWAFAEVLGSENVLGGGQIDAAALTLSSDGQGGAANGAATGGAGHGGTSTLYAEGGSVEITGNTAITSVGRGAVVNGGTGGAAFGGQSEILLAGGLVDINGTLAVRADAYGGFGQTGGEATGNIAKIEVGSLGGSIDVDGVTNVAAVGYGGNGGLVAGGDGYGGSATITVPTELAPDASALLAFGEIYLDGGAFGGGGSNGADGGNGYAELARVDLGSGTMTADVLAVYAGGWGGVGGNTAVAGATGGDGGDGVGGSSILTVGGTLEVGSYYAYSWAQGRAGGTGTFRGAGGQATGGDSTVSVDIGGKFDSDVEIVMVAGANGGAGSTGGDALSGSALIENYGQIDAVNVAVEAWAQGGAGVSAEGGSATTVEAKLDNYGSFTSTGTAEILADAAGGAGVSQGGVADAGSAVVNAFAGTSFANLTVDASARGGAASSGTGGNAAGGYAGLIATDGVEAGGEGSITATGTVAVLANAVGGGGVAATQGGLGDAGVAVVEAYFGGVISLTGPQTRVWANGTGGAAPNGTGGDGIGGYALVEAFSDASVTANNLWVSADGFGGNGLYGGDGSGGAFDGEIYAGAIAEADGLDAVLTLTGIATIQARGAGGVGTSGEGGSGFGGDASLIASNDGAVNAGTVNLLTSGNGAEGGLGVGGYAALYAFAGELDAGLVTLDSGGTTTGGTVSIAAGEALSEITGGALTTDGINASAHGGNSAGEVLLSVNTDATASLGAVVLAANSPASDAGGVSIFVNGEADSTPLVMSSLDISSSGEVFFDISGGAGIDIAGLFFADTGNAMTFGHDGNGGTIFADQITLDVDTLTNNLLFEARGIDLTIDGDFLLGDYFAEETLAITAGGSLTAGNVGAGQSVELNAGTDLSAASISAGNTVAVTAGNNFSVGDVEAGDSGVFTAGGIASFTGTVAIPEITVTSGDIDVADGASLGVRGVTELLTLNAVSDSPIIIGDTAEVLAMVAAADQYHLSEDGNIEAAAVVVNAVGANGGADPDVIMQNLEIEGSNSDGAGIGSVTLNTDGSVSVLGQVAYIGAAAGDSMTINAGDTIEINTAAGGMLAIVDGNENPSGVLELNAANIWAGSEELLDALAADPNFIGRDAMLATNPGEPNLVGSIIAGAVAIDVGETLFVQNSGSPTDLAGITVGAGGLSIDSNGGAPATVVAYGRMLNADGSSVSGEDFFALIDFGPGEGPGFTAQSTFNNCATASGCTVVPPPPPPGPEVPPGLPGPIGGPESILGPIGLMGSPNEQSGADEEDDDDGGTGESGYAANQLIGTDGLTLDQLIDEAVTSGGDSIQWIDELTQNQEQ